MAKQKVHELAKELEISSKDIVSFLQEKGIEAKAAQSSVDDDAALLVRRAFGRGGAKAAVKTEISAKKEKVKEEAEKVEMEKTAKETAKETTKPVKAAEASANDAPKKKKTIIFVSNPQNSKCRDSVRAEAAKTKTEQEDSRIVAMREVLPIPAGLRAGETTARLRRLLR